MLKDSYPKLRHGRSVELVLLSGVRVRVRVLGGDKADTVYIRQSFCAHCLHTSDLLHAGLLHPKHRFSCMHRTKAAEGSLLFTRETNWHTLRTRRIAPTLTLALVLSQSDQTQSAIGWRYSLCLV